MKKKLFLGNSLNLEIAEAIKLGQEYTEEVNVEYIPLKRIDVDLDNPRRTGFNVDNILTPESITQDNSNKQKIYDGLLSLSASIASVGVQQPIKVYRHKDRFKIAFGERRFLASLLAQKDTIPAWILNEKPKHLRSIQYIENMQREELTTWERLQNVQSIIAENAATQPDLNFKDLSITGLCNLTGMSRSRASHYLSVLNGPADVKALIQKGDINNLEKAAYLSRIEEDHKRTQAIQMLLNGVDIKEIDRILFEQETKKNQSKPEESRGRPRTSVNLGTTANLGIIRKIMTSIPIEIGFIDENTVDWNDVKSVTQHWKVFLKALEMSLPKDQ